MTRPVSSDARVELRLDIRADVLLAVTRIRGFLAALFCGLFCPLVWGGGMYARLRRAYVVATEALRTSDKKQTGSVE